MSDKSSIEWTDATWNPTRGCTKIAKGCAHCYAETFAERFRGVAGHPYERGFDPRIAPDKLAEPLKWATPRRIFVDSMSDLFHETFSFEYIAACYGVIAACPLHTFQILTKRADRAAEFYRWLADHGGIGNYIRNNPRAISGFFDGIVRLTTYRGRRLRASNDPWAMVFNAAACSPSLSNVWVGTSIAEQKDADANIPHLLQCPATVRFLSVEPLISDVSLRWGKWWKPPVDWRERGLTLKEYDGVKGISWVIVGGESGHGARPCDDQWVRSIVEQCKAATVPVFVKQLGSRCVTYGSIGTEPRNWPAGSRLHVGDTMESPRWAQLKKKGGDWNEWPADLRVREFPEVSNA